MFNRAIKFICLILVSALLFNMLPAQVFADLGSIEMEDMVLQTEQPVEILAEVEAKRTEYSKEFVLSNGLHMAQLYGNAVHYEEDGQWLEIDNTLKTTGLGLNGKITNTQGPWQVSFPQIMGHGSAVSVTKDGYTLSFSLAGKLTTGGGGAQIMSNKGETLALATGQTAMARIEAVDLTDVKASAQFAETVQDKLYSRLSYNSVYENTNIVYDLQSNKVKESIVMGKYDSTLRGYRYTLHTGSLIPVLEEDGHIAFYDENRENIILVMPAPFLIDAEYAYNYDVNVSLTGANGTYTLSYMLPHQWLSAEDRAWPVILDPVIQPSMNINNIQDCNVSTNWNYSYTGGTLDVGLFSGVGIARAFLKYGSLPVLTSADVVVYADMQLYKATTQSLSAPVEVHKVLGNWQSNGITWANKPDYDPTVEDYVTARVEGRYSWNVTDIVRGWYATGNNYGMMFRCPDYIENGSTYNFKEFWSSDFGAPYYMPVLAIYFSNTNGLESYWDYTPVSAGKAGTGYVNTYTGNLVWTREHMGFGGSLMPVSISHTYNAHDSVVPANSSTATVSSGNFFETGYGWRTNFNQYVYSWNNTFVWEDADGTDHFFYWDGNAYVDEDGSGRTLTYNNNGKVDNFIITDKQGNRLYFDGYGRFRRIQNNQQASSSIYIEYWNSPGFRISTVTDGAGRVYEYTYSGNFLSRISYYGTGEEELAWVSFGYTDGNLTSITDMEGNISTFTYSGHILTGVTEDSEDVNSYRLSFGYNPVTSAFQPQRVTSVAEFSGTAEGSTLTFTYEDNQTVLTDALENKQILQFNNFGNVLSVQDGEGHAQYADYARNKKDDSGKGNQLMLSSKLQNTVGNMLKDHSFENGSQWYYSGVADGWPETVTAESYLGSKSLQITGGRSVVQAPINVEAGKTYTFSAYVKTTDATAKLAIQLPTEQSVSQVLPASSDWTRLQASYTATENQQITLALVTEGLGTVYMDCVQLEQAATASRYSLIENGDFTHTGSPTYSWTSTGFGSADGVTVQETGAPQLDNNVIAIAGDWYTQKHLSQTVSISGSAGDSYVLSGWAKGNSVPLKTENGNARQFGMKLTFHYTGEVPVDEETGEELPSEVTVNFNPDSGYWQYASTPAVAAAAYDEITITLLYDYNCNTAYFDGIQLYKEVFGTSYTYDDDGNVISTVDLQKKETTYEYDQNNNLTAIMEGTKSKMTYTYDDWHNVETATTELDQVYTFEYDTYGNNIKVSITAGNLTVASSAEYTDDGHRLESTTDALGNTTYYGYDADKGLLNWVQYPEDDADSRTNYTYDEMFRMATAAATTDTGLALNAAYTYEDGMLKTIQTPSTTYTFTHGAFDLRENVMVGNRELAKYHYDLNHQLIELDYGNTDNVQYTYDTLGRVIRETYENEDCVTYSYDNDGNLATVFDSATGITTTYYYDLLGRALYYTKQGANLSQTVYYTYDAENNLESLTETVGNSTQGYVYTYDNANRIRTVTVNGTTVTYHYEEDNELGRLEEKVTTQGDIEVKREAYTYRDWTDSEGVARTTSQLASYAVTAGGTTTTWTYTYDANGNILTISDGTNTTSYVYDSANQLVRENNQAEGYTHTWEYDNAGNILNRKEYAYTTDDLANITPVDTVNYTYGDTGAAPEVGNGELPIIPWSDETATNPDAWGDLLTAYDDSAITYDGIGNPLTWGNRTFTWEHGRQLASLTENGTTWSYTYGADGLRTSRTDGTTTYSYVYNGSQLVQMTVGENTLRFTYDAAGTPLSVNYNGTTYYYVTNIQGDVVAIVNASGVEQVRYTYGVWGQLLSTTGTLATTLGADNPLRYRGYVYDTETALHYLQSRYYDPTVGRFINADIFAATGQGFSGNNMFSYCGNNPVMRSDVSGNWWDIFWDVVSLVTSVVEVINNPDDPWAWAGLAGDAVDVLLPCVSGVGEVTRAATTALDVIDDVHDASRAIDNADDAFDIARVATSGSPNQIGKIGEQLAGIDSAAKTPIVINGHLRIPDALTETSLIEVKNVKYISNTSQLRDFADYANQAGLTKTLYVRPTTVVAKTIVDAGWDIKTLW